MGIIGKFLHRVMTFCVIAIGFSCGYFFFYLQEDPKALMKQARHQAQNVARDMELESYSKKIKKLGKKTTHSANIAQLRDNMERVRIMVEAYQVEGGNEYPPDALSLHKAAQEQGYWSLKRNPFRGYTRDANILLGDYDRFQRSWAPSSYRGMVLYQRLSPSQYRIFGCNEEGNLLSGPEGVFYLGN